MTRYLPLCLIMACGSTSSSDDAFIAEHKDAGKQPASPEAQSPANPAAPSMPSDVAETSGTQGVSGANGTSGSQGVSGSNGTSGSQGVSGPVWIDDNPSKHDVFTQANGQVVLQPALTFPDNGWYRELSGPFVYRVVSGNFKVTTQITLARANRTPGTHFGEFSAAGIMVRATNSQPMQQRWLVFNFGYQANAIHQEEDRWATELKWTSDPTPAYGSASQSTIYINAAPGSRTWYLRTCRVGGEFRFYRSANGTQWTEQTTLASTYYTGEPTDGNQTAGRFLRVTPATWTADTQVGLMANGGGQSLATGGLVHETRAEFAFFNVEAIADFGACEI